MGWMLDVQKELDASRRVHGINITVIDDSSITGFVSAATRIDEIYMTDVRSMVANVLRKKGAYLIRRLNILDHGNEKTFKIGSDWIGTETLGNFRPELLKLRGQFAPGGFVHLQHCSIGQNICLLVQLAQLWDVTVYAGTGSHNPIYRWQFGHYRRVDPNGAVYFDGRPNEDTYTTYLGMHGYDAIDFQSPEEVGMRSSSVAHVEAPPAAR
jgi:hypothetical protein